MSWPPAVVVARAYLDQLNRSKSLPAAKAAEIKSTLDKIDGAKPNKAALDQADALATRLEADAKAATGRDAMRLNALAQTVKGRVAAVR
jgi:hypothetical protein